MIPGDWETTEGISSAAECTRPANPESLGSVIPKWRLDAPIEFDVTATLLTRDDDGGFGQVEYTRQSTATLEQTAQEVDEDDFALTEHGTPALLWLLEPELHDVAKKTLPELTVEYEVFEWIEGEPARAVDINNISAIENTAHLATDQILSAASEAELLSTKARARELGITLQDYLDVMIYRVYAGLPQMLHVFDGHGYRLDRGPISEVGEYRDGEEVFSSGVLNSNNCIDFRSNFVDSGNVLISFGDEDAFVNVMSYDTTLDRLAGVRHYRVQEDSLLVVEMVS